MPAGSVRAAERQRAQIALAARHLGLLLVDEFVDIGYSGMSIRALCQKAGIKGVWAPRELRRTFVSVMSESGVAVEEIARLAGHSSSRTTEVIYRHELRPVITTGADVMDKIFL